MDVRLGGSTTLLGPLHHPFEDPLRQEHDHDPEQDRREDREFDEHHQIVKEISNTGVVTTIGRDEYGTVTRIDYGDGTEMMVTPGA